MEPIMSVWRAQPKTILFTTAVVLRLSLAAAFPSLPDLLSERVEIATPVSSFKRLQEGLFLYERGLDPYDGGVFHQAPLLLPLFSLLPPASTTLGAVCTLLLYTALDLLSANSLLEIASSGAASSSRLFNSPRTSLSWQPLSVAAAYLFNPLTLLTCLGRPTTSFATAFALLSISHACQAKPITSLFALTVASYISLHPILVLPAVSMLCFDRLSLRAQNSNEASPDPIIFGALAEATLVVTATILFVLSRLLLPNWNFIWSVYSTPLLLPDLTPNVGLWWYFFIEMFDPFRTFFLGVFWLHMLSYAIPLCLRFKRQPLAAVIIMLGITTVFQPYANVGDAGAWLSCLCLVGHTFELHRYTFPALATLLYAMLLGPAFHYLWLYAGSGNANFFYAITLVWSMALIVLLTDSTFALLRDEFEEERPSLKGKLVAQI